MDLFNGLLEVKKHTRTIVEHRDLFIERHEKLVTVLIPIVLWLGRNCTDDIAEAEWITDDIRELFHVPSGQDDMIRDYIRHESVRVIKFNMQGLVIGHLSAGEFVGMLQLGCSTLKSRVRKGRTLSSIQAIFTKELRPFQKDITFSKIGRYLLNGRNDYDWYPDTYHELTGLLPMVEPKVLFHLMAGTSMNASLKSNIQLFFKALAQYHVNDVRTEHNSAIGGLLTTQFRGLLPAAVYQLTYFIQHGELSGRKINNFAKAMLGDPDAVVVDVWIMRAFGSDRKYKSQNLAAKSRSPEKKLYDAIEYYIKKAAWLVGIEPRKFCSMIWGGIRTESTGSRERTRYTPYMSKYLHFNHPFTDPNEISYGTKGVYFGKEATVRYLQQKRIHKGEKKEW